MRRLLLPLVLLAFAGCKRDAVREMVEKDTDGSPLAVGACLSRTDLPVDACKRVAMRAIDRILAMDEPNTLYCGDALVLADRYAAEKLGASGAKCCTRGLATEVEAICKQIERDRPRNRTGAETSTPKPKSLGVGP